jgi:predicted nuclease of restriction endonuclease-like RecB superfamily
MLRGEHVMARVSRGRLVPHRLSPEDGKALAVAEALCDLYSSHESGQRRLLEEELAAREEELGPRLDPRRGFRIVRALAKLLEERATWIPPTPADPYTIRTRLFELAADLPEPPASEANLLGATTRSDLLSQVSGETGVEDPAALMYADRQGAQLLGAFERPAPEELIGRYNVAQVQGVLYGARELVVDLDRGADARLVFHYVKRMDLIYRLYTTPEGYRLHLDGPLSLFGGTRKYGLRLAKFLPGLLLTEPWRLSASVSWRERDAVLELDSESSGLASHYTGPKELKDQDDVRGAFARAWKRARDTGGWEIEAGAEILPLPERRAALVPDFTLRHPPTGRAAHLEILGFWSRKHLVDRVALIRESARRGHRLLLAASENLGTSPETLSGASSSEVVPFKGRLDVKAVLHALEDGHTER